MEPRERERERRTFEDGHDVPGSEAAGADELAQRALHEEHGQAGKDGRDEIGHQKSSCAKGKQNKNVQFHLTKKKRKRPPICPSKKNSKMVANHCDKEEEEEVKEEIEFTYTHWDN